MIWLPNRHIIRGSAGAYFNGASQLSQLSWTTPSTITPTNGSFCGWIWFNSFPSSWIAATIVRGSSFGASLVSGAAGGVGTASQLAIFCNGAGHIIGGGTIVTNTWYFVALTLGASTTTGYFRTAQTDFTSVSASSTTGLSGSSQIFLGNDGTFADGCADAVYAGWQFFSRVVSQAELLQFSLQRAPTTTRNLESYLPMRNAGNVAVDEWKRSNIWTKTSTFSNALRAPPAPEFIQRRSQFYITPAPPPPPLTASSFIGTFDSSLVNAAWFDADLPSSDYGWLDPDLLQAPASAVGLGEWPAPAFALPSSEAPPWVALYGQTSEEIASSGGASLTPEEGGAQPPLSLGAPWSLLASASEDLARAAAPYDENGPSVQLFDDVSPRLAATTAEDLAPTSFLDELSPPASLFATDAPPQPRNVSEDPAPTAFLDEAGPSARIAALDAFAPSASTNEDFDGLLTVDDAPGPTTWVAPLELSFWAPPPQPEDFRGYLTVDDAPGPTAWIVPPEFSFLTSPPQPEDFQGFLTVDDSPGAPTWLVVEPPLPVAFAALEDFTQTSAALDDGATSVLVLEPPVWVSVATTAEDIASAAAPYDESFPTYAAPEVPPWQTPSIHEDFVPVTVTGFDEQAATVWRAPEPPAWVLAATNPEDLARTTAPFDENGPTAWTPTDAPTWIGPATTSEDAPPLSWLDEPAPPRVTWLDAAPVLLVAPAEDFAPLTWLDEPGTPAWIATEAASSRPQAASEDSVATTVVDESAGLVWAAQSAPTWTPLSVAEDIAALAVLALEEAGAPYVLPVPMRALPWVWAPAAPENWVLPTQIAITVVLTTTRTLSPLLPSAAALTPILPSQSALNPILPSTSTANPVLAPQTSTLDPTLPPTRTR